MRREGIFETEKLDIWIFVEDGFGRSDSSAAADETGCLTEEFEIKRKRLLIIRAIEAAKGQRGPEAQMTNSATALIRSLCDVALYGVSINCNYGEISPLEFLLLVSKSGQRALVSSFMHFPYVRLKRWSCFMARHKFIF